MDNRIAKGPLHVSHYTSKAIHHIDEMYEELHPDKSAVIERLLGDLKQEIIQLHNEDLISNEVTEYLISRFNLEEA